MHPHRWIQLFSLASEDISESQQGIYTLVLKYSPTSVKMRIFKTKTYWFCFIKQSPNTLLFCFGYRSTKGKNSIFATCHKAGSSPQHLLLAQLHLDPLQGLKALLFTCSTGKGFSFSLKSTPAYFKDLPSTSITHLSCCDSNTTPMEKECSPRSIPSV